MLLAFTWSGARYVSIASLSRRGDTTCKTELTRRALVNKGPNAENGKKVLDFVLSDASQTMWGNAYLRPVFAGNLSAEAKAKFLPDADYARAKPVDLKKLAAAQKAIIERYKNEVN